MNNIKLTETRIEDIKLRYAGGGNDKKDLVRRTPELEAIAENLRRLKKERDDLDRLIELHEATLMETIGDSYGIEGLATWHRQAGRTYVDINALREALGDEASQFIQRSNGFRVLKIK